MIRKLLLCLEILKGGVDNMVLVDVYVALVIGKRRTIEQVPANLRPLVLADLNAMGFDGNGDPVTA